MKSGTIFYQWTFIFTFIYKTLSQIAIPDVWYTAENITDEIRRGIVLADPGMSAQNSMRPFVIPPLTKEGFRVISTPIKIQAMLVDDLDACCPKALRETQNEGCGRKEKTGDNWKAINTHNGKDRRTGLCRPPKKHVEILEASYKAIFEEWLGDEVEMSITYGTRIYFKNATLRMHTDRIETHIISAIINLAQDTEEDWPITILDHDSTPHDIVLAPGQSLLYESCRLVHGRPIVFRGRSYANIFVHSFPHYWLSYMEATNLQSTEREMIVSWVNRNRARIDQHRGQPELFNVRFKNNHYRPLDFIWTGRPDHVRTIQSLEQVDENVYNGHEFIFRKQGSNETFQRVEVKGSSIVAWLRSLSMPGASAEKGSGTVPRFVYSIQARQLRVYIHNRRAEPIEVWWIGPLGSDYGIVSQGVVQPGKRLLQETYPGHNFCATRVASLDSEGADKSSKTYALDDVVAEFTIATPPVGAPFTDLFVDATDAVDASSVSPMPQRLTQQGLHMEF